MSPTDIHSHSCQLPLDLVRNCVKHLGREQDYGCSESLNHQIFIFNGGWVDAMLTIEKARFPLIQIYEIHHF